MNASQLFEDLLTRLRWIEDEHGFFSVVLEGEEQHELFGIWDADGRWYMEGSFVPLKPSTEPGGPKEPPSWDSLDQAKAAAALYLAGWMLRRRDDFAAALLQDSPAPGAGGKVAA